MKNKIKKIFWFFANPRLLLCLVLAWIVTNGWSYIMLGLGILFDITWMQAVASAYLAFLWIPVTPEKILTVIIAIFFLKRFFPKDEKTLAILHNMFEKVKTKRYEHKKKKQKNNTELREGKGNK